MTFVEQLDYYGKLSAQFPIAPLRLIYSKAGSLPACAILRDLSAIVENRLYWTRPSCEGEAHYLMAVLNSETARSSAEKFQSRGQWGARDFDKAMLKLPIPEFDPACELHAHIGELAQRATNISAAVALDPGESFVRSRTHIRDALHEDGVADEIDKLVAELLGPAS